MGRFEERFWEGRFGAAMPPFDFDSDVAADVSDAERAATDIIGNLDAMAYPLRRGCRKHDR